MSRIPINVRLLSHTELVDVVLDQLHELGLTVGRLEDLPVGSMAAFGCCPLANAIARRPDERVCVTEESVTLERPGRRPSRHVGLTDEMREFVHRFDLGRLGAYVDELQPTSPHLSC